MIEGHTQPRKFTAPPLRGGDIDRSLLVLDRLNSGLEGRHPRIVLVRGPAGYGKTTLLSSVAHALQRSQIHVSWLTCDEDDAAPAQLMANLSHSAQSAGIIALPEQATDAERFSALLGWNGAACLILDDFERAASTESERAIERLLDRVGNDVTIIIGSRQPLRSWFLRREVAGEALTIGAGALRFSLEEIAGLLPETSHGHIAEIEAYTEGWPFAVRLMALQGLQPGAAPGLLRSSGDSAGLFDYLSEQVMASLDEDQRSFLLDMSVIGRIDAHVAEAVLGRTDSASMIRSLQHLNPIMAATSDEQRILHVHPLFRQFLAVRTGEAGTIRRRSLHRRAALYFEQQRELASAIEHAVAAEDAALISSIFARAGNEMSLMDVGVARMASILSRIPDTLERHVPGIKVIDFLVACVLGYSEKAFALSDQIRSGPLPELPPGVDASHWNQYFDILLDAGLSFCSAMETGPVLESLAETLLELGEFFTANPRARALILSFQTLLAVRVGHSELATRSLQDYQAICEAIGVAARQPSINPQRGLIAFLEGRLDEARDYFERSTDLKLDEFGAPEPLLAQFCRIMLARTYYEQGRTDEAAALTEAIHVDPKTALPDMIVHYCALQAKCGAANEDDALPRLLQGSAKLQACRMAIDAIRCEQVIRAQRMPDLEILSGLEAAMDAALDAKPVNGMVIERLARAVLPWLNQRGERTKALELADRALGVLQPLTLPLVTSAIHILRAEASPDRQAMVEHVTQALRQNALPQVYIDTMVNSRIALIPAFAAIGDPDLGATIRRVLEGLTDLPAISALTDRERDILVESVVRGSNKEIARALALSPETVKYHLRNIFGKLGVHGREEAVSLVVSLNA
ncbi:hypothetical protein C1T17_04705 [Sphingobium sp. SCG-1]|uniref:LuxR C-terminal-related transcriptional regulator n=1 Tax=Sphingobium sp. SCG-1 TaxID=2072936 RepID=UPI000CD681EA|nr:LuxR C-terminal-related transcriptional regulator [Sphingobium sp. SCG-1]AUW57511.1 hypothetical protein C1T17_04705 [Sphingobium sp. SCG-1]